MVAVPRQAEKVHPKIELIFFFLSSSSILNHNLVIFIKYARAKIEKGSIMMPADSNTRLIGKNAALEIKKPEFDTNIRIDDPSMIQKFLQQNEQFSVQELTAGVICMHWCEFMP